MKKKLHSIHLYSSLFFLPLAFIYALSGIFFLTGYYGNIKTQTYEIKHNPKEILLTEELKDFLLDFLSSNQLKIPNDKTPKPTRDKKGIEIGVMSYIAQIKQEKDILIIKTFQRDFISNLLALHFAQGRWYFDVLGICFGIALGIFYLSGILMIRHSKYKKPLWITFFLGLGVTSFIAYWSSF
ncbi:hypothetical protein [Helicobacter sp. 13S00477-4]|uniref:hypothetical protein n=1 Tax=Helicobacter sp. 13S00477-4 TaxID=1905759 RepID=UPI000BA6AE2E|nr:hypothetical protein [Helicobacter sp. 13S00477-4]PAF52790.1 hypothetical protein BKH44_00995 [Helicobacter sp. 13S00477-4]